MDNPVPSVIAPTAERIATVDIVRGFALFGILVVNLTTFRSPYQAYHGIDSFIDGLIVALFQGKFLTLYSLLFGVSFTLFMRKSTGRTTLWRFAWRALLLLLIGAVHYIFLWEGDILLEYALAAFLLLPFARRKAVTALRWGVGFYSIYALFLLVVVIATAALPQAQSAAPAAVDPSATPAALLYNGSYIQLVTYRAGSLVDFLGEHGAASVFLVGIFLIGVYAGKSGILADPVTHTGLLKKVLVWGLLLGLVANVIYAAAAPIQRDLPVVLRAVVIVIISLAPLSLALAYAAGAALLAERVRWLAPLAAAGRMSLTNYLLQSLVMTILFYHYGFSLYNQVGPAAGLLLAAAIYLLQVGLSNLWFRRFNYGPVEWIWRSLTYGRWVAILVKKPVLP